MVRVSPGRKLLERRIQAAKEGIDLLSVAQDLTTLRKKGERWRGKCPICENGAHSDAFSLDDTLGLFTVSPAAQEAMWSVWWSVGAFSVAEAVAWLGHTYDLDLPERPELWYRKQDRQARLRQALIEERREIKRRRLFKYLILPEIEKLPEADQAREAE